MTAGYAGVGKGYANGQVGYIGRGKGFVKLGSDSESPVITSNPASQSVDEYGNVTFTGAATGDEPITYQWYKNGSPVGTNSDSYTMAASAADNGVTVYFTATNSLGSATSSAATLTVVSYRYVLNGSTQYQLLSSPIIFNIGDSVTFDVTMPAVYTSSKSIFHGVNGSATPPFYIDLYDTYITFPSGFIVLVDGIESTSIPFDGSKHSISVTAISTVELGVIGCHRGLASRFFSGSISNFVATIAAGNVTIPLNNKDQGANQLATSGSINSTIINYNEANWVAI